MRIRGSPFLHSRVGFATAEYIGETSSNAICKSIVHDAFRFLLLQMHSTGDIDAVLSEVRQEWRHFAAVAPEAFE